MNDTTIEPDSPADRTEPRRTPTRWVLRRAPEPSNKITVAWGSLAPLEPSVRSSSGFDVGKPQVDALNEFGIVEADAQLPTTRRYPNRVL